MEGFVLVVLVTLWLTGALLLGVAGALHLFDPKPLHRSLVGIGMLPVKSGALLVRLWALVELTVSFASLFAFLSGGSIVVAASATAIVYSGFTAFLWWAVHGHDGGECACVGVGTALDISVLVRAAALTLASTLTALVGGAPDVVPTLTMAAVLALLSWLVPAALHPADDPFYGSTHNSLQRAPQLTRVAL